MVVDETVSVHGAGVVADGVAHAGELGARGSIAVLDEAAVDSHDILAQLAIRAVHQAWQMAGVGAVDAERVGMLFVSAWGTVDPTVAYMESMLEAEGKYASPRHFSRSVYSSVTSVTAIHFGIRGACETLAFAPARELRGIRRNKRAEPGGDVVQGAMRQAWRMLARRRVDRMVVVWAEQAAEISATLVRRAATELGRAEYRRFEQGLGYGAVAVIAGRAEDGRWRLPLADCMERRPTVCQRPFMMDGALGFVEWFLARPRLPQA